MLDAVRDFVPPEVVADKTRAIIDVSTRDLEHGTYTRIFIWVVSSSSSVDSNSSSANIAIVLQTWARTPGPPFVAVPLGCSSDSRFSRGTSFRSKYFSSISGFNRFQQDSGRSFRFQVSSFSFRFQVSAWFRFQDSGFKFQVSSCKGDLIVYLHNVYQARGDADDSSSKFWAKPYNMDRH